MCNVMPGDCLIASRPRKYSDVELMLMWHCWPGLMFECAENVEGAIKYRSNTCNMRVWDDGRSHVAARPVIESVGKTSHRVC